MECRASFGEAFEEVEVADYDYSRGVLVAEIGLEWIGGGFRSDPRGW